LTSLFVYRSIELTISYVYLSLHSYADRDNVGLPGFAEWFKNESDSEREHAQLLLNFQNKRGGRVKLHTLVAPEMECVFAALWLCCARARRQNWNPAPHLSSHERHVWMHHVLLVSVTASIPNIYTLPP